MCDEMYPWWKCSGITDWTKMKILSVIVNISIDPFFLIKSYKITKWTEFVFFGVILYL